MNHKLPIQQLSTAIRTMMMEFM